MTIRNKNKNIKGDNIVNKLISLTNFNDIIWYKLNKNHEYVKYNYNNENILQYYTKYKISDKKYIVIIISHTDYNIYINFYYKNINIESLYLQHVKSLFKLSVLVKYNDIKNSIGIIKYIKNNINKDKWDYIKNSNEPFYVTDFLLSPNKKNSSILMVFYNKVKIVSGVSLIDIILDNSVFNMIGKKVFDKK